MESEVKRMLVDELRSVSEKILVETDTDKKLFFLDMASYMLRSYLFFNQDDELIFTEFVLEVCHGTITSIFEDDSTRLSLLKNINESIDSIAKHILDLAVCIENQQSCHHILQNIVLETNSFTRTGIYQSYK